jgi:hypothetical protein
LESQQFFAVATMFNMNMLQSSNAGDVSLESIAVMAQAQSSEDINMLPEATFLCGFQHTAKSYV